MNILTNAVCMKNTHLIWWVLQNECGQLVAHVNVADVAAGETPLKYHAFLGLDRLQHMSEALLKSICFAATSPVVIRLPARHSGMEHHTMTPVYFTAAQLHYTNSTTKGAQLCSH